MMNRRRFLRASGGALGVGALGLGAGLWHVQPRRQTLPLPDGNERLPDYTNAGKRVVVIGGGVAGLAAATELAARHFDVTLVERAPQLGGKLTAWPVHALGREFPVEHGFHGFFAQYYNLRALLDAAGVAGDLAPSPGYPVLFADRPPETFGKTTKLFPLNMLSVVRQSKSLHLADFARDGSGLYELMRYDERRTFERFDGIDFATFAVEGKINRPMVETVLAPFGKTTLNRLARLSAAEAIRFFHFYFMGNPEGLGFSYLRRDSMAAVVGPLARRLEALGGRIRAGLAVRRLERDGAGRVARVIVDAVAAPPAVVTLPSGDVGPAWRAWPAGDGASVFVRRRSANGAAGVAGAHGAAGANGSPGAHGTLEALDGRCTHMGCPVALDEGGGFRCPCHGGRFDDAGVPIAGPPKAPLARLVVRESDGRISVGGESATGTGANGASGTNAAHAADAAHATDAARAIDIANAATAATSAHAGDGDEEALACDYVVVACDTRGTRQLLDASRFLDDGELRRQVSSLGEADPYVVWRLWLDKPTAPARLPFYTTSGFRYVDSLAIYSAFQEPFVGWARQRGGSVVEIHAYAIAPEALLPAPQLRATMWRELVQLLPELDGARLLHDEFQQQANFSSWAPGDAALRPATTTPVANLLFAGDWVRLPAPASLMEAAAMSGRLAANAVCAREGLRQAEIPTVPLKGPLA